ncbi:hypothetical protein BOTBODRAFT_26222 [Botryobasidium botryosum FD-172 SS1]|uniref:Uncharacterized protein n=1 Tax=Botryobasidium botryosum (strain FD-172 SS1) TaxID=930990 RepID=A0A067NDJ1_BOTB1|nr:hypothetical protein BOTBODRAFT_26222 [Botryobasidium botryosum FD-172 SS1]
MASKYANLPDIDSAQDVYETPDAFSPDAERSSDDESGGINRARSTETTSREDLDSSHLPNRHDVGQMFRKAERKRTRTRTIYAYPPSPNRSPSRSPSPGRQRAPPLKTRLRALQHELASLEAELADPSNPLLLADEGSADAGEMMRGLVEIRARLLKLGVGEGPVNGDAMVDRVVRAGKEITPKPVSDEQPEEGKKADISAEESATIAEVDRRLGELEKLVGSSSMYLDESSPLPQPLLPHITRLSSLLTLLTQPRHIDSISRRLKLLLTDLERYSASTTRRSQPGQPPSTTTTALPSSNTSSTLPPDIGPLLTRLSTALPTIPHLLARLRTLSTLHSSASSFASGLSSLEADQAKMKSGLDELERAVEGLEKSLDANGVLVEGNLRALVGRLDEVQLKIDTLEKE